MSVPWGTSDDQVRNEMALSQLLKGEIDEFRRAFQRVDDDQDGAVTYTQFMAALKVTQ
jgi:Ca2+-binding EF-hand superfamily protein